MKIDLIPVLSIAFNHEGMPSPVEYPYWEHAAIWDAYHQACHQKTGLPDSLIPYLAGSRFYELSTITDNNLALLTIRRTQEMRDGQYTREEACTFRGGYVLRIDGLDRSFPQCCGELSDIAYWENISRGMPSYCEEHPSPIVKFDNERIFLDYSVGPLEEAFEPTPIAQTLTVDQHSLQQAVAVAKAALIAFEQRLLAINMDYQLGIDDIGGLLIWDNANHQA